MSFTQKNMRILNGPGKLKNNKDIGYCAICETRTILSLLIVVGLAFFIKQTHNGYRTQLIGGIFIRDLSLKQHN